MNKGFTLVESLVALALLSIAFVGAMAFYSNSTLHTQSAFHKRTAAQIADSVLEQIKKTQYYYDLALAPGSEYRLGPTTINIRELTGTQNIYVVGQDTDADGDTDYKKATVEIAWDAPGKSSQEDVKLDTYIYTP